MLFIIGVIEIVGGFSLAIYMANVEVMGNISTYSEFSFVTFITYFGVSFVVGMLIIGISEIINILYHIRTILIGDTFTPNDEDGIVGSIQDILSTESINSYIDGDLWIDKGGYNKTLGVTECALEGNVNESYAYLTDGQKHYVIKKIAEKISHNRSVGYSNNHTGKITYIYLKYNNHNVGYKHYQYSIDNGKFYNDNNEVTDYEEIN